ncbi:MAG: electron transfer flavoprotein subunit alpha/FixB family protein [Deltaproteobacteria bacterium]|nr:MAG: electron transfer flavoprotein subunit alpha/FixB family protein [Deltaproteobacteria bacterium]
MSIVVCAEQRDGKLSKVAFEALSEGKRLAAAAGDTVKALVIGSGIAACGDELKKYGADEVVLADNEALAAYTTETYAAVLAAFVAQESPALVLMGHSTVGRELAARAAGIADCGLVSDCIEILFADGDYTFKHPIYAGKAIGTFKISGATRFATLRPNVFAIAEADGAGAVVDFAPEIPEAKVTVKAVNKVSGDRPELTEADIICSGGRGLGGPEGFKLIEDLADSLGAAVGSSRAAVDAGWRDHAAQVGQTGKVVSPNLYVASGISGAIQHLAGMGTSKYIVGINKDGEANIFNVADYGIEGDLNKILPVLTEKLKEA